MNINRPRVMIVDDHSLVAEGVSRLLVPDFELVGVVSRYSEVLPSIRLHRPEVVLLDISMPGRSGIETAREIRESYPEIKIVFLTMHTESVYVQQAMRTGAQGYLLKSSLVSELIRAIRAVLRGKTFVSSSVEPTAYPAPEPLGSQGKSLLSPKQQEVLELVASGRSAKEIANVMNISVKTVEFHKTSIRRRLGLHSTAELTRFALMEGTAVRGSGSSSEPG